MSTLPQPNWDFDLDQPNYGPDYDPRFPESDGLPMAENTEQYAWIVLIKENLEILFASRPDVFIAADLFWYPVESERVPPLAPDTMVVFGRPKGRRGSYKQWREQNIPPQVVFEIESPGNTRRELQKKFEFYQTYGVEEYYLYRPDQEVPAESRLQGWQRQPQGLVPIDRMHGWISPRLGIRFEKPPGQELRLYRPDGIPFLSSVEIAEQAQQERQRAEQEHLRAEQEHLRAEQECLRAEQERLRAEQERHRSQQFENQLQQERQRAQRLAEQLRSLGINPDSIG